jgi:hypothetical protein
MVDCLRGDVQLVGYLAHSHFFSAKQKHDFPSGFVSEQFERFGIADCFYRFHVRLPH